MEYQTGVKKKDTLEITELLNAKTGEAVKVNGAVHTIRDMGTVAFVILRKREGLLQSVPYCSFPSNGALSRWRHIPVKLSRTESLSLHFLYCL